MESAYQFLGGPNPGFGIRRAALAGAGYTMVTAFIVITGYLILLRQTASEAYSMQDVYLGVQVSYVAIAGSQLFVVFLTSLLFIGIIKESCSLIVPWVVGFIAALSLEAIAIVYSNVLRDHINKEFDSLSKLEVSLYILRASLSGLALAAVVRFHQHVQAGCSWKAPEVYEL